MAAPDDALPSGIVTFVLTDIEGSTRALRRLGDAYPEVLGRHREVLRRVWSDGGGHVVDATGDSMFVAFADASSAVDACAAAQIAITADVPEVRVRMGVHAGLAAPRGDAYVALAVHQTARVMAAAHGGQILVSSDAARRADERRHVELLTLGRFRLRDFDSDVELFLAAGPGLPRPPGVIRAIPAGGHNLVRVPTSFVGREDAVVSVVELVAPGRILTLTGPGGAGKTRLATEAALRFASRWPDGVWLVDLAPVHDPSQVGSAIAAAIGAPASDGDWADDVIEHLRDRRAVVVLDSCEHLVRACASAAARILATCGACAVLATSREPLGVPAESVWRLDALEHEAAKTLFFDRARRVRPDITVALEDTSLDAIDAICRRLDGNPLALELAAARLAVLSPTEILDGLDDRFRLLQRRGDDVPERQRSMRALLDWSDRLLGDDERACFRRLALFADSFTLEGAAVATADDVIAHEDVAELVWSLVEKSLVTADLRANGTRYRLLETVREFARERLVEHGELDAVAQRLARWYLDRLGPRQRHARGWTRGVAAEVDNLRALVPVVGATDPERADELAFTIGRFLDASHAYREGIIDLTRFGANVEVPTPARVSMLTTLADLHLRTGDTASAEKWLGAAETLLTEVGALPEWDDVAIERTRGDIACRRGDPASAIDAARRALAGSLSPRGRARMWSQLGIAAYALGDLDTAKRAFDEELAAYRALDDEVFQASAEGNLAEIALRAGDVASAARHQRACLDLAVELGTPVLVALSLTIAARIAAGNQAWGTAVRLQASAESIFATTGFVLYDADRQVVDEMLLAARESLGSLFDSAEADGRSLDLPAAVAKATEVLDAAGHGSNVPR